MPYIYKITNLINGKMYVGKTSNTIEERWREHVSDSHKERCEKRPLYDAFNKYGIDNFQIEQIEEIKNDDIACEKEIYWINELRTYIGFEDCNGYNATLGGDSKRYYNYKELAQAYLELKEIRKVCIKYNCDPKTVKKACEENNIQIKTYPNQRKIKRISLDGKEIKEYNSLTEAAKELFSNKNSHSTMNNISRALHSSTKKAYNYIWEYINE